MKRILPAILTIALAAVIFQLPHVSNAATPSTISATDSNEIATSYGHLTTDFYKKVDSQQVLDSVRTSLQTALKAANVTKPLPAMHALNLPNADLHSIDTEVAAAAALIPANAKLTPQLAAYTATTYGVKSKLTPEIISYAAINGMMSAVKDRYTVFLPPSEYGALNDDLDGTDFGGTGMVIQIDDKSKYIVVSNVVPDSPSDKAGLQQDDTIVSINGKSTHGMTVQVASSHLRGKVGTTVTVSVLRDGKTLAPIALTRAKIHQISVFAKMLPDKIGYVALTVFGRDTGSELTTALQRLQQRGARAFVMDLRDNGGGYIDAAVAVSSKFISSGPIVSVESRASSITTLEADATAIPPMPLAVLVNKYTASASEITSGAIQDDGVGTIIGTKTFGKGVVQTVFPLGDGSAVKITTARYLTPDNRDINHRGITPDVVLGEHKGDRYGDPARDAQLQYAMKYLTSRMARLAAANGGSPT